MRNAIVDTPPLPLPQRHFRRRRCLFRLQVTSHPPRAPCSDANPNAQEMLQNLPIGAEYQLRARQMKAGHLLTN